MIADNPFLLVPIALDGSSERAIEVAQTLARGREVRLFSWSSDEGEAAAAKRHLVELARKLPGHWSVEVACTDDRKPLAAIVRAAAEAQATVCMATDRAGQWGQTLVGSTGHGVVEATGRAILVGPGAAAPHAGEHGSLLACLDGSRTAEQVLPLAEAWAEDQALDLRLVRVVSPATPYPIESAREDEQPWTYLCNLANVCGDPGHGGSVAVLYGDAAAEIARHAEHASLVAMVTTAHPGVDLALHRSTAMRVVHRSPRPVLLVKAAA